MYPNNDSNRSYASPLRANVNTQNSKHKGLNIMTGAQGKYNPLQGSTTPINNGNNGSFVTK